LSKKSFLRVGDLAKATDTKVETIRWYEKVGILPTPARTAGNYRAYGPEHLSRLSFVRRGRDLGFTLDEVRALLELADQRDRDCGEVDAIARQHLADVERKIVDLQKLAAELHHVIGQCRGGSISECRIIETLAPTNEVEGEHYRGRCPYLRRRGARRNRRVLFRLGLAADGQVAPLARPGPPQPRRLRLASDPHRCRLRRAGLRSVWRHLHRRVPLLALGRREQAAGPLGRYWRGRVPSRRGRHPARPQNRLMRCERRREIFSSGGPWIGRSLRQIVSAFARILAKGMRQAIGRNEGVSA
jgi:Cu(I)-responsive transcriptional regulator